MSFNATVYFNDEDIYSTRIYAENGVGIGLLDVTKYYGNTFYTTQDFPDSTLIKITATPADGCEFTQWVYRIGGDEGEQQFSTDNPFYYGGPDNIIIRAEGKAEGSGGDSGGDDSGDEEPTQNWNWSWDHIGTITDVHNETTDGYRNYLYVYRLRFENDGVAAFYSSYSGDTIAWLSDSDDVDEAYGRPSGYILEQSYNSEGDFYFDCTVSANTYYYLFVRHIDREDGSDIDFYIEPPSSAGVEWNWSNEAYYAFLNKGKTTNVPYTEWNEFVEFVEEKTGYYLSSALMTYSDTKLYADKFNVVREAIGSVNTFKNGTNSIKDHYNATGSWNMASKEVVKGQYFVDLTKYLNDI